MLASRLMAFVGGFIIDLVLQIVATIIAFIVITGSLSENDALLFLLLMPVIIGFPWIIGNLLTGYFITKLEKDKKVDFIVLGLIGALATGTPLIFAADIPLLSDLFIDFSGWQIGIGVTIVMFFSGVFTIAGGRVAARGSAPKNAIPL